MITVFMLRNDDMYKVFESIQDAFRYLREFDTSFSDNELYDVINKGIDDHSPWHHNGAKYDFRTYGEKRLGRLDRSTRK